MSDCKTFEGLHRASAVGAAPPLNLPHRGRIEVRHILGAGGLNRQAARSAKAGSGQT